MHTIFQLHIISHLWGGGGEASITDNHIESNPSNLSIHINETSHHTNKQAPKTNQTPFCFHILTDGISQDTKEKLKDFERELNKTYPCQFRIYTLLDSDFQGLPKLNGNYLAYFRLKMASHLPQEITTCLYLDVDMLCVSDIRGIFDIDLGYKVCAVVLDVPYCPIRAMPSRYGGNNYILNPSTYFNSGFMLVNLTQWRKENVEQKCLEWLSEYTPQLFDQDALNAVLSDKIHILPLEWNFLAVYFSNNSLKDFKGESDMYKIIYTHKEYIKAQDNLKILHYSGVAKPWELSYGDLVITTNNPYYNKWWEIALNTPIFYRQIHGQGIFTRLQKQEQMIAQLTEKVYYLRKPHKRIFRTIKRLVKRLKRKSVKLT